MYSRSLNTLSHQQNNFQRCHFHRASLGGECSGLCYCDKTKEYFVSSRCMRRGSFVHLHKRARLRTMPGLVIRLHAPHFHEMTNQSALIIGATGATGKKLLNELLSSPHFARVGEYGRRWVSHSQLSWRDGICMLQGDARRPTWPRESETRAESH